MKSRLQLWWKSGRRKVEGRGDQALAHTCAGRVVQTLRYLVITLCLVGWITAFLLLKDHLVAEAVDGRLLSSLTCAIFFGGLVSAVLVGALAGNFLHRLFWSLLTRHAK